MCFSWLFSDRITRARTKKIINILLLVADEGTFPAVGTLSSRDLARLVGLRELCVWLKKVRTYGLFLRRYQDFSDFSLQTSFLQQSHDFEFWPQTFST